jgi:hypothetical protein
MSAISKINNLKQPHIDYIILAFARTSDLLKIKEEFHKFFETQVSGDILLQVAEQQKDKILNLKNSLSFEDRVSGIDIADPVKQLEMLDHLRTECMKERIVNMNREGVPTFKVEFDTARKCIELANKIVMNEKLLEVKKIELGILAQDGQTTIEERQNIPQIQIVHKREEDE